MYVDLGEKLDSPPSASLEEPKESTEYRTAASSPEKGLLESSPH